MGAAAAASLDAASQAREGSRKLTVGHELRTQPLALAASSAPNELGLGPYDAPEQVAVLGAVAAEEGLVEGHCACSAAAGLQQAIRPASWQPGRSQAGGGSTGARRQVASLTSCAQARGRVGLRQGSVHRSQVVICAWVMGGGEARGGGGDARVAGYHM